MNPNGSEIHTFNDSRFDNDDYSVEFSTTNDRFISSIDIEFLGQNGWVNEDDDEGSISGEADGDDNGSYSASVDSDGSWKKWEYDDKGNIIYYENSDGYWSKYVYDEDGNKIYLENSEGYIRDNR